MPYKYIGRTTYFKGKSLWEIVGNLKNFGVGRIVVRSNLEKYPEKSYMKILKVETLPNPENPSMDNMRKVKVWVENTFRGRTFPEPILIEGISYKTDYRLIPKAEEQEYRNSTIYEYKKILPKTMNFPPLLKDILIKIGKSKGEDVSDLKLNIFYNQTSLMEKYKIAEGDEQPTVEIVEHLGTPVSPRLYEGVNFK
ncbi:uncharacterized protein LOC130440510 [Diorhabda sublineata]|uniref:uncharacterized protein LOC130440510 n=1 Tax=Diorhabda sublineata TaxID=1163346 RepID=UPI0024E106AD|nr:uncharacterized protein LOC130440510 [Diorhabda sublineata]